MAASFITPELFRFLRALTRNNNRDWFEKNKSRYHDVVRDPLCAFVEAAGPKLRAVSSHIMADSRPVGGSLFRIYRDTRFSKDKSPYKTQAAVNFRTAPKNVAAPSFYLHLAPGDVFVGMGIWHPDADALRAVRDAIVDHTPQWKKASKLGLAGEPELKRVPRGYDADHPFVEDLRRKNFAATIAFSEEQACEPKFLSDFVRTCRRGLPLVGFLGGALGVKV